jgi:formyltetrahydrofolate deformylase
MSAARGREYVLTLSCPDKPGIVYAVSSFLVQHSANILASQQYGQPETIDRPDGRFFMRVHFSVPPGGAELAGLERGFSWVAEAFHMTWELHDQAARIRTLIMVSRLGHCLNDLLFRWKTGSLPVEVAGVVSNHADFAELAASYRIPFRHIPVTPPAKAAAESQLLEVIDDTGADLIVLARYMQILSGEVCKRVEGRMINIHHSFLPSFKGRQALSPGPRARRQAGRRHRPLRDPGPGRGPDHRAGRDPGEPHALAGAPGRGRP